LDTENKKYPSRYREWRAASGKNGILDLSPIGLIRSIRTSPDAEKQAIPVEESVCGIGECSLGDETIGGDGKTSQQRRDGIDELRVWRS
jgi:hypothetical protein